MTANDSLTPFWHFSLALYGRPNVKTTSLALQDSHGDDVVLVYACLYAAIRGAGALPGEKMDALLQRVTPWQTQVTLCLRAARRTLGEMASVDGAIAKLKDDVLALELAAERVAHDFATPFLGERTEPRTAADATDGAWSNLRAYRAQAGRALNDEDTALFGALIEAALLELDADERL